MTFLRRRDQWLQFTTLPFWFPSIIIPSSPSGISPPSGVSSPPAPVGCSLQYSQIVYFPWRKLLYGTQELWLVAGCRCSRVAHCRLADHTGINKENLNEVSYPCKYMHLNWLKPHRTNEATSALWVHKYLSSLRCFTTFIIRIIEPLSCRISAYMRLIKQRSNLFFTGILPDYHYRPTPTTTAVPTVRAGSRWRGIAPTMDMGEWCWCVFPSSCQQMKVIFSGHAPCYHLRWALWSFTYPSLSLLLSTHAQTRSQLRLRWWMWREVTLFFMYPHPNVYYHCVHWITPFHSNFFRCLRTPAGPSRRYGLTLAPPLLDSQLGLPASYQFMDLNSRMFRPNVFPKFHWPLSVPIFHLFTRIFDSIVHCCVLVNS